MAAAAELTEKSKTRISPEAFAQLMATVQKEPAIDYKRYELKLPRMPPGVTKSAQMAMDDASSGNFAFLNSVGGALAFGLYFPGYPYLAEIAQRSEYRQPVETTAKEMTRKWVKFKSTGKADKSERIQGIEDELRRFKVREIFKKVTQHDGFYGLGNIFIAIKGQTGAEALKDVLEITPQTIEKDSLLGFNTIEPMWMTPLTWNSNDPTSPTFYKPQSWNALGKEIHASRLLTFISREIPDIIKPAYNFGGLSLSQLIEPYVQRWLKTVDSVNRLVSNFSIINLQTDFGAVLQGGDLSDYENLVTRVKFFTQERNNQGVFLTDKEREMLLQLAVPLSGLSELQAQAQEHQAAPTHLPLVVLTGITPAGLNASSDSELEVFHDWIHSSQEDLYRPPLQTIVKLVQLNRWGNIDEDIDFEFVQLKELDGEAAARVRKMAADAAVAYVDSGITDPQEERQRLASDPDSGYVNINPNKEITPPALEEMDGQHEHESALAESGASFKDSDD
jgi:phage-related protein (TIGR01555 family)